MSELALPIACILSDAELRQRRETILQKVRGAASAVQELESGYAYQFPASGVKIAELAHLIETERQCCPFLKFQLTIEPGEGPMQLEITGPAGTKEFLSQVFN
ncbi:MAG TPA: hypothetical protein VMS31_04585 [Pyrinomonadaceae bacterium]|nr:hypothetical protein [Pyrinomonadaceae bacterium]